MKSSWTLLTAIVLFSVLLRTIALEWPDTDGAVVKDRDDDDSFNEFEDKMIRTWIEHFIEKYYKNIQSSTKSANIQRIAKKNRMSALSTMPVLKYGKSAPLPVYPVVFKPYYPTVYSSYIPMTHGPTTTRLIPISQEEYYQRFMAPLNTYSPYGYTYYPEISSSTPVNNHLKIKKPYNVQVYVPQQNQDEIRKYDKPEEILIDTIKEWSNQNPFGFDQTLPTGLEEPDQTDEIKDEKNESPIPTRDGKLLDKVDSSPVPVSTQFNQTTETHENQHSLPTNTVNKFDTSTPHDIIVSPERHDIHFTPTSRSPTDGLSTSDILNGLVSQLPLDARYHSSDQSSTTTTGPTFSTTSIDRMTETTVETEISTASENYFDGERSNAEEKNQQGKPRDAEYSVPWSSVDTTTSIPKPINETERKTAKTIIETTQNPETLIALFTSPPPRPATAFHSTTLCVNNSCGGLKSSHLTTPSVETTVRVNAYDTSVSVKTINSTTQPTSVNSEYGNRTTTVSASDRPSSTSTIISEMTTTSYKPSTTIKLSSPTAQEVTTPPKLSYFKMPLDKIDEVQSVSSQMTSSTLRSQPLNDNYSTTPTLIDNTINQTLSATTNANNYTTNIKRNANDSEHFDDKSTISYSTTTVPTTPAETIVKTDQIVVPSNINKSPIKPIILIPTTTEKMYNYKDNKINNSMPFTVKETTKSTLKPITTHVKTHSSTPRPSVKVTDGSKNRNSATNRDRYMAETTQSSLTTDDLDLWYSHVNTQHPHKKELNEQEIDYLLKKLIKLLKPEIEKQTLTNDSISRFITPKTADREKLVYIIFPMIRDVAKNMNNEEKRESNPSTLKNVDKK